MQKSASDAGMMRSSLKKPKIMQPTDSVRSVLHKPFMSVAQPETQLVYIKDQNNRIHRGQFLLQSINHNPGADVSNMHIKTQDAIVDSARKPLMDNVETSPEQLINNTQDTDYDEMQELKVDMLSLKNLVKHMEQYMPLNPRTKLLFSIFSKVTSEKFCCKIMNPFYSCWCKKK